MHAIQADSTRTNIISSHGRTLMEWMRLCETFAPDLACTQVTHGPKTENIDFFFVTLSHAETLLSS
jgi:hypothetical protein